MSDAKLHHMEASNHLLDDIPALRQKFDDDGFLFFEQIVPQEKLQSLRDEITDILAGVGWIKGGADKNEALLAEGILPQREGEPGFFAAHDEVMKLESFHAMPHQAEIMKVMTSVLGETAWPHPLSIARLIFPNNIPVTTPPHQDFPNNQGSDRLTAAWMPLGDCPMTMGPLKILRGSHKMGLLPLQFHLGAGNRGARITPEFDKYDWVARDFKAGDLVVFGPLTIHAAMDNIMTDRMRLSVDFRFQCDGEALTEICLKPHFERLSWEDIYAGWKSDKLKYYWKERDYKLVEWDSTLHDIPEEEAMAGIKANMVYDAIRRRAFKG